MRLYTLVLISIAVAAVLTACGGGSSTAVLAPKPIPSEYQGLPMEQLKLKSSDLSYQDILGNPSTGESDPNIADNIMKHEGSLFFSNGIIEKVYPSSQEGVFTLRFCSSGGVANFSFETNSECVDPLFLLYDLDRGPELKKGDLIDVSGTVVGNRTRSGSGLSMPDGSQTNTFITPSISVIRAEFVDQ